MMRVIPIVRALLPAALLIVFVGQARAQAARDVLQEVTRCAEIADATARLACFDAAVPRAKGALAETVKEEERKGGLLEWFGFARPRQPVTKPEAFGKPAPPVGPQGEITAITATVVDFARTVRGAAMFVLDNGQIWRQLDADDTRVREPQPGTPMKVTIEVGFLGSYNLTIDGRNPVIKVFRLK
jgi:hypothetical protein